MKSFRKKIVLVFVLLCVASAFVSAQYKATKAIFPSRVDNTIFHYGYSIGIGVFDYRITNSRYGDQFGYLAEQVDFSPALRLGVIGEWNITNHSSLRAIPGIYLGKRKITYTRNVVEELDVKIANPYQGYPLSKEASVGSIYAEVPVLFKYRGVRINNYNFYLLGGFSYRIDFAKHSNLDPAKDKIIRTKMNDFALEFGAGMDFYLRYFKLGAELRISLGLLDVLNHELVEDMPNYHIYTQAIGSMRTTTVTLAFNFE